MIGADPSDVQSSDCGSLVVRSQEFGLSFPGIKNYNNILKGIKKQAGSVKELLK